MTWLARTLMPTMTSRLASTQASVRSMSIERMSISSLTRLQATRPIEPMLRKALMRSRGRLDDEFAEAVEIGLAGRARVDDGRDAALDAAEATAGSRCRCRRARHGRAGRPSPARRKAPLRDRCRRRPRARRARARPSAMRPSAPIRMSTAPCGAPGPKPTGFTPDEQQRRPSFAAITRIVIRDPFCSRGSRRSRRPSPTICSESTESTMAMPGNSVIQSACPTYCRPAAIMVPQVGISGLTPRPRKERPASASMA